MSARTTQKITYTLCGILFVLISMLAWYGYALSSTSTFGQSSDLQGKTRGSVATEHFVDLSPAGSEGGYAIAACGGSSGGDGGGGGGGGGCTYQVVRYCCGGDDIWGWVCPPPPPPPSCTTFSCTSAANACGMTNSGTQSSCGGGCSASTPPDHLCTPSILATPTVRPPAIREDDTTTVTWTTEYAQDCTLTASTGLDTQNNLPPNGSTDTAPVPVETEYTLQCSPLYPPPGYDPALHDASEIFRVRLLPGIEEN